MTQDKIQQWICSVRWMVSPEDLKGLFQPKLFCDYMILKKGKLLTLCEYINDYINHHCCNK